MSTMCLIVSSVLYAHFTWDRDSFGLQERRVYRMLTAAEDMNIERSKTAEMSRGESIESS